jgi:hypothetical protein
VASSGLDVTDWRVLPCENCEQITKIVRGTCERCGRDLSGSGGSEP